MKTVIEIEIPQKFIDVAKEEGLTKIEVVQYIKDSIEFMVLDEYRIEEFREAIKDSSFR